MRGAENLIVIIIYYITSHMKFLFEVNNNGKVWSSVVGNLPTLWQVVN